MTQFIVYRAVSLLLIYRVAAAEGLREDESSISD